MHPSCQVYTGHAHSFEKNLLRCAWSADGRSVTCGSANREVFIWAADTKALQYRLPGHKARRSARLEELSAARSSRLCPCSLVRVVSPRAAASAGERERGCVQPHRAHRRVLLLGQDHLRRGARWLAF